MPIESQTMDGRCMCRISGALNIWEVAAAWQHIRPLLSAADPLVVDLTGVAACDGAGLQILCQMGRAAAQSSGRIAIGGLSQVLTATLTQAGFAPETFIHPPKEV